MRQIWRMWLVVKLFFDNKEDLALELVNEDALFKKHTLIRDQYKDETTKKGEELSESEVKNLIKENYKIEEYIIYKKIRNITAEPCIKRESLTLLYINKYYSKDLNIIHDKSLESIERRKIEVKINSDIQSCIDLENGFINASTSDQTRIYLTTKGKKFAAIDGLILELLIAAGKIRTLFVGAGGATIALLLLKWLF